jgi:hypothetical protein
MKRLRQLHLYLGVFFTPLLVFFVGTGWYQTVNPERLKSASEAETWEQKFRVVHTDQIYPGDHEVRKPSSPKLFQALVVAMSAALLVTTIIGVILAFRFTKSAIPVAICLVGGVLVPILILWAGRSG